MNFKIEYKNHEITLKEFQNIYIRIIKTENESEPK